MLEARDYHFLSKFSKAEQRRLLVHLIFGGYAAAGRELGRHRVTILQVATLKRKAQPTEDLLAARVARYGKEFAEMWAA